MSIEDKAAENILEGVFSVYDRKEHYINTNNNGILNTGNIRNEQTKLLKNAVTYMADEVVTTIQHYPVDDFSLVEIEVDVVVLKRKDFEFLKEQFQKLITDKYE